MYTCIHVCVHVQSPRHIRLFATPWTVAHHALLFMGSSKQEYWSRLPFVSPRDLPEPGIEPASPMTPALATGFFTTEPPGKPIYVSIFLQTHLPSRLPHNIERSSVCYTAGPCWLSILNLAVCTCPSQTVKRWFLFPNPYPHTDHKGIFKYSCQNAIR